MNHLIYIIIIILLYIEFRIRNIRTLNILNIFSKKNEIATYNHNVHYEMFNLIKNKFNNKKIKILEIGAGNGNSTENFIYMLNKYNYNYEYTINELYIEYKNDLINLESKLGIKFKNIFIKSFEKLNHIYKYDLIFLTAMSALNKTNINAFYKLCNNDTIIITIGRIFLDINNFFTIIKQKNISFFLNIYYCKIPNKIPNKLKN
jgi:hypothetical protein